jgi:3-phytase
VTAAGDLLLVSSQGDSEFAVYTRDSLAYLGRFDIDPGSAVDGCSETDGIDATSAALGSTFPRGIFICQDGWNGTPGNSGNQNFKFVDFGSIDSVF